MDQPQQEASGTSRTAVEGSPTESGSWGEEGSLFQTLVYGSKYQLSFLSSLVPLLSYWCFPFAEPKERPGDHRAWVPLEVSISGA